MRNRRFLCLVMFTILVSKSPVIEVIEIIIRELNEFSLHIYDYVPFLPNV
jgi:hypothetical protein